MKQATLSGSKNAPAMRSVSSVRGNRVHGNWTLVLHDGITKKEETWKNNNLIHEYIGIPRRHVATNFTIKSHKQLSKTMFPGNELIVQCEKVLSDAKLTELKNAVMIEENHKYAITKVQDGEVASILFTKEDMLDWYKANKDNILFVRVPKPSVLRGL